MRTKTRNAVLAIVLGITLGVGCTWLVDWSTRNFYLSTAAEVVIAVFGGLAMGAVAGYIFLELEERRRRVERDRMIEREWSGW